MLIINIFYSDTHAYYFLKPVIKYFGVSLETIYNKVNGEGLLKWRPLGQPHNVYACRSQDKRTDVGIQKCKCYHFENISEIMDPSNDH